MKEWKDIKKELLANPDAKKEYDRLAPRYALVSQLISVRNKAKITQKELAHKIGTKQSAIARLESGNTNPSVEFLERIAKVLGYKLTIQLSK
jgi:predicted transcriptional regulator